MDALLSNNWVEMPLLSEQIKGGGFPAWFVISFQQDGALHRPYTIHSAATSEAKFRRDRVVAEAVLKAGLGTSRVQTSANMQTCEQRTTL